MSQPVGDLVVKIDGDSAKFDEEVAHLNKQLSGLGRAANDSTAQSPQLSRGRSVLQNVPVFQSANTIMQCACCLRSLLMSQLS